MYVVVRRYSGASALVDVMIEPKDEVQSVFLSVSGFRAYYAVRRRDDTVATFTVCDTSEGTDESTRRARVWVRDNVAGASIPPPEITESETYIDFEPGASSRASHRGRHRRRNGPCSMTIVADSTLEQERWPIDETMTCATA